MRIKRPLGPEAVYRDFGRLVRAFRQERNISQELLADRVGLTRTSITNIEGGTQRVSLDLLIALADALAVDARLLLPETMSVGPVAVPSQYRNDQSSVRALTSVVSKHRKVRSRLARNAS